MPAKPILHAASTEPLVRHVRSQVADGTSLSADDAVRIAIEKPMERERREAVAMTSRSLGAGQPFGG